jgi:internalin A
VTTALRVAVEDGIAQLRPDTEPATIEAAVVAAPRPLRLQFDVTLPDDVLAAAADALRRHPEVELRVYGREVDPRLGWLSGFEHIEHLSIELWHATSFDVLARFTRLRSLGLGETNSKRPSLAFLRELPHLEDLWLEAHEKDFAAVAALGRLRRLALRVPRAKSLEALRGHSGIEVFSMDFGGIRDLSALPEMPNLRAVQIYQVRKLDTGDLDPLGECAALEVLSLGALRNVESLRALARRPAATLRLLTLERLTGLATLADLNACTRLEELGLYESRPADRRLDGLLQCPNLNRLVVGDVYPPDQVETLRTDFHGDTLVIRGEGVRGDVANVVVRWRAPVHRQLEALS